MTAAQALSTALLELAEQGRRTPCQGRRRDRWTSDDAAEREWAAAVCVGAGCPVMTECGAAADEFSAVFVWGGVDRTPPPARPKPTRRTTRSDCDAAA